MIRYLICFYLLFSVGCDWPIGTPKPLGPTPDCGDSYLTEDETCDDGNDVTELCDYGATECMVCDSACQYVSGPTRYCGDGALNAEEGEECDNANLNADDSGCLDACISATCGDGLLRMDLPEGIEGYEACDDGEGNNDLGACLSDCVVASCGDGFRRQDIAQGEVGYEACDDGTEDSEICDAFDCSFAECGDGYVNAVASETCDDGNRITERCLEDDADCEVCGRDCTLVPGSFCGDGIVNEAFGEACDDGNDDDTDGCLSDCQVARCGDGFVHAGFEACDDANDVDSDACRNNCEEGRCGDGVLRTDLAPGDDGYEVCDDGNLDNTDTCLTTCAFASCGDGFVRTDVAEGDPQFEYCDDAGESSTCRPIVSYRCAAMVIQTARQARIATMVMQSPNHARTMNFARSVVAIVFKSMAHVAATVLRMFSSANSATTVTGLIPVMDVAQTVRRTIPAAMASWRQSLKSVTMGTPTPVGTVTKIAPQSGPATLWPMMVAALIIVGMELSVSNMRHAMTAIRSMMMRAWRPAWRQVVGMVMCAQILLQMTRSSKNATMAINRQTAERIAGFSLWG